MLHEKEGATWLEDSADFGEDCKSELVMHVADTRLGTRNGVNMALCVSDMLAIPECTTVYKQGKEQLLIRCMMEQFPRIAGENCLKMLRAKMEEERPEAAEDEGAAPPSVTEGGGSHQEL